MVRGASDRLSRSSRDKDDRRINQMYEYMDVGAGPAVPTMAGPAVQAMAGLAVPTMAGLAVPTMAGLAVPTMADPLFSRPKKCPGN